MGLRAHVPVFCDGFARAQAPARIERKHVVVGLGYDARVGTECATGTGAGSRASDATRQGKSRRLAPRNSHGDEPSQLLSAALVNLS